MCLIESGWHLQPTVNVTIDTLHLVFSAFGTVHKIATFEKSSGFQALVQYPDSATADQVCTPALAAAVYLYRFELTGVCIALSKLICLLSGCKILSKHLE